MRSIVYGQNLKSATTVSARPSAVWQSIGRESLWKYGSIPALGHIHTLQMSIWKKEQTETSYLFSMIYIYTIRVGN